MNCGFDSFFLELLICVIMFIEDTTPIAALTVADLKKLLKDSIREQKIEAIPPVTSPSIAR